MTAAPKLIRLGLSMTGHGYHHSAWLHPDVPVDGPENAGYFIDMAQTAERGLFDMVFMADFLNFPMTDEPKGFLGRKIRTSIEPMTLLAAIATHTSHVGLVATASTTFGQPFHVARQYASLDLISGGRAGWNVVTSFQDDEAANFGSSTIIGKTDRYDRAQEFVDVVAGLWNSFEPDAFVRDRVSGVYFDPGKVHPLNHTGHHYQVRGPIAVAPSPQQRPIIVQAGSSEEGQELAARTADVVYTVQRKLEEAQKFYATLKARMDKYGRARDQLKIMPGILPILGKSQEEADARYAALKEMLHPLVGLNYLYGTFGDLSGHDLDGPVPDLPPGREQQSRAQLQLRIARENNLSIRQLYQDIAIGNSHLIVVGTPEKVADTMQAWIEADACDGFNVLPVYSPAGIHEFVDQVVPVLQARGIYRTAYESTTLRGNLGLDTPVVGAALPARIAG